MLYNIVKRHCLPSLNKIDKFNILVPFFLVEMLLC